MIARLVSVVCIAAALVTLGLVAAPLMPLAGRGYGTDWGFFFSYLLAGEQWGRLNGWLAPAYFTPAFCGGMPFLANPQSMLWSPLQLLFAVFGPDAVPWWTLLICAAGGGAGTWLLARRRFALSVEASALTGVLFVLNGFLTFRLVAGHASYWVFALLPWIAWLVLGVGSVRRVIVAALLLAAMVFGGALNFVVPAVLAVAALVLLRQARDGFRWGPWISLGQACIWSAPLAAIKIVPSAVFTLQYPRDYLAMSIFTSPVLLANALVSGFFWPQNLPGTMPLGQGQFAYSIHEIEFGVSLVPLLVLLTWGMRGLIERRWPRHVLPACLLALVLIIPLAGSVGNHAWGHVLQQIPVINSNTTLIRWWSVYVIPLILLCAIAIDDLVPPGRWRPVVLAGASAAAIVQFAARDLTPYHLINRSPPFDAAPIAAAHARLAQGGSLPPVTALGRWPAVTEGEPITLAPQSLVAGVSSVPCYEPIFGYDGKQFRARELHPGPVSAGDGGFANLADPRCYLDPGTGSCRPGARFAADDPAIAAFVSYRAIPWSEPLWQVVAAWSTVLSLIASAAVLALAGVVRRGAGPV